jgi:hypothetical protein
MSIKLQIERMVIDEALLGGKHAASVRQAVERELVRQLSQPGTAFALRRLGSVAMLSPTTLPTALPHDSLGARVASAVQQSLCGGAMSHD